MIDKLDGATVLMLSEKGNYGYIKIQDSQCKDIGVCYLAICKYDGSEKIYLFLCDENMNVENDWDCDSIEEAVSCAQNRAEPQIVWTHTNFIDS